MREIKINQDHPWAKQPRWKKRLNGVACYAISMFVSLINPEAVDMALYKNLRDQFIEGKNKNC